MEEQSYWFITVMERIIPDSYGFADTGAMRCWGFYKDRHDAEEALHNNMTDLWEGIYHFAVMEEYYEGICAYGHNRQFFMYDQVRKGYFEIGEPECVKNIVGFSIC